LEEVTGSLHKGEDFLEVALVVGGPELFFCEAAVIDRLLQQALKEILRKVERFFAAFFANLIMIFLKEGIQDPMPAILYAPMGANIFLHFLCLRFFQTTHIVVNFTPTFFPFF
jgi:hypothetical protein